MAALAKITVSFGLVTAQVSVHNALLPKISNVTVCTGTTGKPAHAPTKIAQKKHCTDCGEVAYAEIKKARDVGGEYVLLEADEIKTAKGDADKHKKLASFTPHPAGDVESGTIPGEKLYYLKPEAGQEATYDVLRYLVQTRPHLTFVALWTPRSAVGQFALRVRDNVLVMQERVPAAATSAAPVFTADAPAALKAMADQVLDLPGMVTDFDPEVYVDTYEIKIQAILAAKVGGTAAPVASTPTPVDAGADLLANLAAMVAAKQSEKVAA